MSAPEEIEVDGVSYVRAYPVCSGRCVHCGGPQPDWTPAKILHELRDYADRHGQSPKEDSWDHPERPGSKRVRLVFGGWSRALIVAGLPARWRGPSPTWTQEYVIGLMRAETVRTGVPPMYRDWLKATVDRPASRTISKRWGWNATLRAAGFGARGSHGVLLDHRLPSHVDAAPVAEAIREYVLSGGSRRKLAALAGVNESTLTKVAADRSARVTFDFADRVLCAISRPELLAEVAA